MAASPGTVRAESVRFLESQGNAAGGAAGIWSASFEVPAGAVLIDVIVHGTALWTATTSATLIVGDVTTPSGIFAGVDLKATDLLAGESLSFSMQGGKKGADLDSPITAADAAQVRRRQLANVARTLSCKVTTVGAPVAGVPGDTTVTFVYAYPSYIKPSFA